MAAIPKATRYFQPGIVKIYFATTLADPAAPTRSEITGATDLTPEIDDIAGWTTSTAFIETKDASSRVRPQLAGATTFEGSSITFNGSSDGQDARTVFTRGQTGYIVICDSGDATGKKADVYPVEVGAIAKLRSLDNAPFKIRVDFGITGLPDEEVALPA